MTEQYIVAVLLDATLNVDACGPFRSRERAEAVRDRINEAGAWTDHPDVEGATIIAEVVPLRSVADLVAAARPPSDYGEVGTGAGGETDPASTEATAWVNRSVDCPEAPAQAHLPVFDGPVAGTCRACGQDLVHEPGERTYHPYDVKWPEGKCPELLPLDEHTDALSTRVPDSQFIPDRKRLPEDVTRQAMAGGFPPHDDGRLCMYHARLGKWTFDGINECLRAHPDPDAAKGGLRG